MRTLTTTVTLVTLVTLTLARDTRGTTANNCTYTSSGGRVVSADCSHRGWTQVPKNLPPTLLTLNLSGNKLVTLPGSPFRGYQRLETLDLSENQITRLENSSLSGLFHLRRLSLRRNMLRMKREVFPDGAFQDLRELQHLDLHLNQPFDLNPDLVYPDRALSSLSALRTLKMDGLVANVDLGPGFAQLHRLQVLDISNGERTGYCFMTALSEKFFFHINTSQPLKVNLTDCKLRSIHNNTLSFLPTLHTLDLHQNRHLKFPQFRQASQGLRWTQIRVLDISQIYRDGNIKITAEDFRYLAYTWLERLTMNNVNAYDIDLRAIFNLPTSLKYLSFYDNKLINATFLFGLYLLPHLDTVQMSRQNHFSSKFVFDIHNHTYVFHPSDSTNKKAVALQTHKNNGQMERHGSENQRNDTKLHFMPNRTDRADRYSTSYFDAGKDSSAASNEQREQSIHAGPGSKKSATLHMMSYSNHTALSLINKPLLKEKPDRFVFENRKITVPKSSSLTNKLVDEKRTEVEGVTHRLKRNSFGNLPQPLSDPTICFDSRFKKAHESRIRAFFSKLKSFLLKHNVQFNKTANLQTLLSTNWTSPKAMPKALQGSDTRQTTENDSVNRNVSRSAGWADFPGEFWPLPLSIRYIYASELKLGYIVPKIHFLVNQVQTLDISKNNLPCFIGPLLGLHQLRSLDLSRNFAVYLSQDFFEDMPELTHLYLQGNFLGDSFANDSSGLILRGLKSLKVLKLDDNSIKHLSSKAFVTQKKLTHLSLARNAIRRFTPRLGHMTSLTFLDLSENSLDFLQREVMDDLDAILSVSNLTVDLHNNPLSCGCESLEFWAWVIHNAGARFHRLDKYTCTVGNGSVIGYEALERELDSLRVQCQGAKFLAVAVGLLVALLFCLSVLGILHYKRWHLRYFYYVGLRRLRHPYDHHHHVNQNVIDDVKDVFISFDDDSGDCRVKRFVEEVLQPELECQGLTYYTSEGQFAGRHIKDIIPEAILGARKTLAIFSAYFFPSYERELEFNMAVYHEEKIHRHVIVSAVMGPVDWSTFPPEVWVYLEEHPCTVYRQNEDAAFVQTLVEKIRAEVRL